jgi:soluble lytic murein transglycosylase-like protein
VAADTGSFELPEPGEPRLNSLTNPALPIPPDIKALYIAAGEKYGLPWTLLAGIGMAETAHGRIRATSSAGAQGLMQFMPATWRQYGVDGNGDGRADILNDADSIMSAANYLTASGVHNGPEGVRDALFAYNRADWYVNDVLSYTRSYGGGSVGSIQCVDER